MGSNGQPLVYWPVDVIANVVNALVLLRNEVINNVYQIIGISDIMRGSTEKEETLGAQQLKAQFGSVRIRDKQRELVRIARDTIAIMAEIMAEHFSKETLLAMSQMDIPSDADIRAQVKPLEDQARNIPKQAEAQAKQVMQQVRVQAQQATQDPQMMQKAQENPGAAQQMLAQATEAAKAQVEDIAKQAQDAVNQIMEQIAKLQAKPTIEQVMRLLRDDKLRPFILDIETDSTIAADEQAEKQSRTEFVTALGGMIQQFGPVMMAKPELAPMVGGLIKFALAPFRVGRELDGLIDEAVDNMGQASNQPPPPNPDAIKAQADAEATKQKMDLDKQLADAKLAQIDAEKKARDAEAQAKIQTTGALADQKSKNEQQLQFTRLTDMAAAEQRAREKHAREMESKGMDMAAKTHDAVLTHVKGVQDIQGKTIANAQSKINGKGD
jgi:hypothetical protein